MLLWIGFVNAKAQTDSLGIPFFQVPEKPIPARIWGVSGGIVVGYSAMLVGLNELWYKNYPRSNFHWYNDFGEWEHIDKIGHLWTSYSEGLYMMEVYRWTGLADKKAIWIGGTMGSLFQTTIEILDGFSAKWGASPSDLLANSLGSALVVSQALAWNEQKFQFKFSSHQVNYNAFDASVQQRVNDLYGTSFMQLLLKDYNGQTYWLSFNPFYVANKHTRVPHFLQLSLGYGAENMLGGYENIWEADGVSFNRNDIPRLHQYYLSLDVDLRKIKTRSRALKIILGAFNIIKIPAPTLEINSAGKVKGHWLYF